MTLADLLVPLGVVSAEGNLDVDGSPPGRHSCGRRNPGPGRHSCGRRNPGDLG